MPEISTLEVDFDCVNAKADAEARHDVAGWKSRLAARQLGGHEQAQLRHSRIQPHAERTRQPVAGDGDETCRVLGD